ncbi:hypothetical protein ABBQ32_001266 [Trebouxia sp. C0010 RCD-2024]
MLLSDDDMLLQGLLLQLGADSVYSVGNLVQRRKQHQGTLKRPRRSKCSTSANCFARRATLSRADSLVPLTRYRPWHITALADVAHQAANGAEA